MKISRYFVEIILFSIVACLVASPFMKSDAPPTVMHDTVYFLESTSKNGLWLKQKNGIYEFYKLDTIVNNKIYIWNDKPSAPIYGVNIDSCYSKSNGWDGVELTEPQQSYVNKIVDTVYLPLINVLAGKGIEITGGENGIVINATNGKLEKYYDNGTLLLNLRQSDKKKTMSLDKK